MVSTEAKETFRITSRKSRFPATFSYPQLAKTNINIAVHHAFFPNLQILLNGIQSCHTISNFEFLILTKEPQILLPSMLRPLDTNRFRSTEAANLLWRTPLQ